MLRNNKINITSFSTVSYTEVDELFDNDEEYNDTDSDNDRKLIPSKSLSVSQRQPRQIKSQKQPPPTKPAPKRTKASNMSARSPHAEATVVGMGISFGFLEMH